MRKFALIITVLLLAVFLLAACSQDNNNATETDTTSEVVVVPTNTATPTPTLPATFTPVPGGSAGHLFVVGGTRSVHIVQRGETLGSIANMYGTTVQDLARTNRIVNSNLIETGDVLLVPPCD